MANTEWWQRGPIDGIPAILQPVAHILLQVRESVGEIVEPLTEQEWNARPLAADVRPDGDARYGLVRDGHDVDSIERLPGDNVTRNEFHRAGMSHTVSCCSRPAAQMLCQDSTRSGPS